VITTALSRLQALPNPGRPAPTTHTDEQLNAFGAVEPDAQPTR
jgi:hypothetical protein